MPRKNNPTTYVTRTECARISGQIREELSIVKKALVGEDMRGGILREIRDMKSDLKDVKHYINGEKTRGRDWRLLGFAVLGSITSGTMVAILNYLLNQLQ